jgi:type IV pilus assembly protein PilC
VAQFEYKARDPGGRMKSGKIAASSKAMAKNQLLKMRLRPITIKATKLDDPSAAGISGSSGIRPVFGNYVFYDEKGKLQIQLSDEQPTTKDLIIFTKQFATMIASGVPLIQAMGILAAQQRVRSFGRLLDKVRYAVENGGTLSDSFEAYPKIFDPLYISMVRAGEASGNLDTILLKLVSYVEKAAKIKSQVKSAMMYPAIVIATACLVITGLLVFVVPTFAAQYADAKKKLPFMTEALIDLSNFLMAQWHILIGGIIVIFFGIKSYSQTPKGKVHCDRVLLNSPVIGILLKKIAVGRFCSTMATMLSSGVNLLEAFTICASAAGNKVIEDFVLNVRSKIEQGTKISEPLGEGDLFPPMVVSMVAVGEATGALDEMLTKVSEFYEEEVDLAVKTMLSMIEPIMIVGIGGIVGIIVIALYLPIFDMASLQGG